MGAIEGHRRRGSCSRRKRKHPFPSSEQSSRSGTLGAFPLQSLWSSVSVLVSWLVGTLAQGEEDLMPRNLQRLDRKIRASTSQAGRLSSTSPHHRSKLV